MIDPATGWIEIDTIPSTRVDVVSNMVDLAWLTRSPLSSKVIVDHVIEFVAGFKP